MKIIKKLPDDYIDPNEGKATDRNSCLAVIGYLVVFWGVVIYLIVK